MKKRSVLLLIAVVLLICLCRTAAFADGEMRVICDPPAAQAGKTLALVLKTEQNPGLMGFRLTVSFDPQDLHSPAVSAGEITASGSISNSIGTSPEGTFDVLWTNTAGVAGDGTLLTLVFTAADPAADTAVNVSFSPADTFTETWETVEIPPLEIPISFSAADAASAQAPAETDPSAQPETTAAAPDSESARQRTQALITAVEKALEEYGKTKTDQIPEADRPAFVNRVNELNSAISGGTGETAASFEALEPMYTKALQESFTEEVIAAVEAKKIVSS